MFALHRRPGHQEQRHHHQENDAEVHVQLLADCHASLLRGQPTYRGSNLKSIIPLLSVDAGSKRHFRAASSAAVASTGGPPTTLASFTLPFGATTISILTVPARFILRASSGYTGSTLVFARRTISSVCVACAAALHGPSV